MAVLCLAVVPELHGQWMPSDSPRRDLWFPDRPVNAILETNGVVYLGGAFTSLSPTENRACLLEAGSGLLVTEFPKVQGFLYCAVSDGAGGWYLGGDFTLVGDLPRTNLARLLANHDVDPFWAPAVDGPVYAMACSDSEVFFGGRFKAVSGEPRFKLASVDRTSGNLTLWNPNVCCDTPQEASRVLALALDGSTIFAGGVFSAAGGNVRNNVAALSVESGEALPWPENQPGTGHFVSALDLAHERLYVGGRFDSMGGVARANLAAIDPVSGAAAAWSPNPDASVLTIASGNHSIYAGGTFTTLGGQPRQYLGSVNAASGLATSWNPSADGPVHQIRISGSSVYVGGQFATIGNAGRPGLALLDANSNRATSWTPSMPGKWAQSLTLHGSRLLIGNRLADGEALRNSLAAFDSRSGRILDWNPDLDGPVFALAFANNTVYAGGDFLNARGAPCVRLASLDAVTGAALPFAASASGPNGPVETLAVSGDRLFVGGGFSAVGQSFTPGLAAFQIPSGQILPWRPIANQAVHAMVVLEENLYAAGSFTSIGGQPRNCFAALATSDAALGSWNPDASAALSVGSTLGSWQDVVFVGGSFTRIGGEMRLHLAAVDRQIGLATAWNPALGSMNDFVQRLTVAQDRVYVGGSFSEIGGQPRTNLALVDAATGDVLDWNPAPRDLSIGSPVSAIEGGASGVYVGGSFTSLKGERHRYFAAFAPVGAPEILLQPEDVRIFAGQPFSLKIEAAGDSPLSIQWQRDGVDITGATAKQLVVTNAPASDSGVYSAVVTNAVGLVRSASARVTVLSPLSITMQPVSRTVVAGSSVTFAISASGNPFPRFQWSLNGQAIPGAVEPTFTVNQVRLEDGGQYAATVFNGLELAESHPAELVVADEVFPLADNFADREDTNSASGTLLGNNRTATFESTQGEPLHADKPGGRSVWLSWIAPATGIATFHTRGSDFDTLLAAYSFSPFGGLDVMSSDDDGGGFLASEISFNAIAGKPYEIAIDGYFGGAGRVVLSWNLETTGDRLPRIQLHPMPRSVRQGESATFNVIAFSGLPLSYQWLHNDFPISGATNSFYFIPSVQPSHLGHYTVRASSGGRSVTSRSASLEIGSAPAVFSQDKLEELFLTAEEGENLVRVELGAADSQRFTSYASSSQFGEPIHAGVPGGVSRWMRFRPSTSGMLSIDTAGSGVDTTLAVYTGTNIASLVVVASDDNGAPDAARSQVRCQVEQGRDYFVAVDGVNGEQGRIHLNWNLGMTQLIPTQLGWQLVVEPEGLFFRLLSDMGQGSVIEATTNLVDWFPLQTNTSAGPLVFTESVSTNLLIRFYRLVPWP